MDGVMIKQSCVQPWQTIDDDDSRYSTNSSDLIITHLQQSILKLCNAKVQYNDKLQILGVICLTIDNIQQEVVIKLNNTLKKVDSEVTSNTIIASPSHIITTPPPSHSTLVTPPLSLPSRRKRTIPIKHEPLDSFRNCRQREDDYNLSSDEDNTNEPIANLQLSSLPHSPSEPGEVKRLKSDAVLDFSRKTPKSITESIPPYLPYDFSRSAIHSNSMLALSSNAQFNSSTFGQEPEIQSRPPLYKDLNEDLKPDIIDQVGYINQDRHENEFMVDKLGMEGKKRRRRAPDESLTNEEILEYMGGVTECEIIKKEEEKFTCHRCYEQLPDLSKYLRHTLVVHSAYICHECGRNFTTKSSLLRHRPIHTGMRRFACSICKKAFYRKDKCKAHIKRHLLAIKPELAARQVHKNISSPTILSTPNLCISPGVTNSLLNLPPKMINLPQGMPLPSNSNLLATDLNNSISLPRSNISMLSIPNIPQTSSTQSIIKKETVNLGYIDELRKPRDNIGLIKPFITLPDPIKVDGTFTNNRVPSPAQFNNIMNISTPNSNGSHSTSIPSSLQLTTLVNNITKPLDIVSPSKNESVKTPSSHPVPTTSSLEPNTISSSAFKSVESLLPV